MSSSKRLAPLERLSDEIFLSICDEVKKKPRQRFANDDGTQQDLQSLKALSHCTRRFRSILAEQIFQKIRLWRPKTWPAAADLLDCIRRCEHVAHHTKSFEVDLLERQKEGGEMSATFMPDLVKALTGMPKLDILTLHLHGEYLSNPAPQLDSAFVAALDAANTSLPSVRFLDTDKTLPSLVGRCPNLESLVSVAGDYKATSIPPVDLIGACKHTPNLKHFEVRASWSEAHTKHLIRTLPNLSSFGMVGHYDRDGFGTVLPLLAGFKRLKTLIVEMASELDVGFDPPECGNAYMGPDGDKVAAQVERDEAVANEVAARMCFEACRTLEVVWVGEYARATVERKGSRGGVEAVLVESVKRRPGTGLVSDG